MPTPNIERHPHEVDPAINELILAARNTPQNGQIELIASENFTSQAVLEATGSIFTNKYAEGYPGKRYYGGCEYADEVENLARERARKLFSTPNTSTSSRTPDLQANQAAFAAVLQPGDTITGPRPAHGGHLTHGHKLNFSGKTHHIAAYQVNKEIEQIDFDHMASRRDEAQNDQRGRQRLPTQARLRPASSPEPISVGAQTLVDMAHISDRRRRPPRQPLRPRRHRHFHHPQDPSRTPQRHHSRQGKIRRRNR